MLRHTSVHMHRIPGAIVGKVYTHQDLHSLFTKVKSDFKEINGRDIGYVGLRLSDRKDAQKFISEKLFAPDAGIFRQLCNGAFTRLAAARPTGWYNSQSKDIHVIVTELLHRTWDDVAALFYHEICHADQHMQYPEYFDLLEVAYSEYASVHDNVSRQRLFALSALIEGDATFRESYARETLYTEWQGTTQTDIEWRDIYFLKLLTLTRTFLSYVDDLLLFGEMYTVGSSLVAALHDYKLLETGNFKSTAGFSPYIKKTQLLDKYLDVMKRAGFTSLIGSAGVDLMFRHPSLTIEIFGTVRDW